METTTTAKNGQAQTAAGPDISLLVSIAWKLLRAGLFFAAPCPQQSESLARNFIRSFITNQGNPYTNFAAFCQRILMTRRYILQNDWYHFDFTLLGWLDPGNALGFAGTAAWYDTLQDKRKIKPLHLLEMKALPEALLELAEDPSSDNFHYWNNWFNERKAWEHMLMLQLVAVQIAFDPWNPRSR